MKFVLKMFSKSLVVVTLSLSFVSPYPPGNFEQKFLNFFSPKNQSDDLSDNDLLKGSSGPQCSLPHRFIQEIESYQPVVNQIVTAVTKGLFKGKAYEELAYFVDKFGSRLSGTKNLEDSLDYLVNLSIYHNLENVHGEPAVIPQWERGNEFAMMIMPRQYKVEILGLGGSVSTPPEGITAEILVVNSFNDLHRKAHLARGKIIVFNQKWVSYPISVQYRVHGAVEAAKVGGVASLIRSITPKSLYSPHTGWQEYDETVMKIPTACITVEDAEMFQRMSDRGENILLNLYMEATMRQSVLSKNIIAEVTGKSKSDEIVLLSGHVDSWDVGQGAMDDGAGAFVSLFGAIVLKQLGLRPKRTVRVLMWTSEENGLIGAKQYVNSHGGELDKFDLVMESDEGTFTPEGIRFSGVNDAACILQKIAQLMGPLNATKFEVEKDVGTDIIEFLKFGVPGVELILKSNRYFWYHHTNADTMTVLNSDELDRNVAMFAALAFITADLSRSLPRTNELSEGRERVPFQKTNLQNFNGINLEENSNFPVNLNDDKYMEMSYDQGNNFIEDSLPKKSFDQGNQIDKTVFRLENNARTDFSPDD